MTMKMKKSRTMKKMMKIAGYLVLFLWVSSFSNSKSPNKFASCFESIKKLIISVCSFTTWVSFFFYGYYVFGAINWG